MHRLLAVLVWLVTAHSVAADDCRTGQIDLRGDWGQAGFTVEIADTPADRSRGLMFRNSMARGAGMLFVYESPRPASFWMKNTFIELDILFADQTGRVTRVHHRAIPGDLTPIDGGAQVYAVLEINGGLARSYGITRGSLMRHPVFAQGPPAWPC